MNTMDELTVYVKDKALAYLQETESDAIDFPLSIVDFVVEYAIGECHFPAYFDEERIVSDLSKIKNSLAMACIDVYSKVGAEGELQHTENGISRQYKSAWITNTLSSSLPNYVTVL